MDGPGFKQQDASAWISFDPDLTGHRKDVRSAAAKSSAAARKATIAKRLALNTDCDGAQDQASSSRSKKRRREQHEASPISASSTATLHSSRPSNVSLSSLASTNNSSASSGTVLPCLTQASQMLVPVTWDINTPTYAESTPTPPSITHTELQRALCLVLGIEAASTPEADVKEPTHFGASRVKSRAISSIHNAIGARRAGSNVLLAVALMAAWDLKFGDQRSSLMHLRAWHQLALPQNILPRVDGQSPANATILEAIRLSLQCHLPPEVSADTMCLLEQVPYQHAPRHTASGSEILFFFDTVADLVETMDVP